MSVSLIVATLGRADELGRLFDSLRGQTYTQFDVIVVDQNLDDRVERVIHDSGQELSVRHLRSEKGLSRARNLGLSVAKGEIVAFPDDDCWYPENLLERVVSLLDADQSTSGVTGKCADERGQDVGRSRPRGGELGRFSVWTGGLSAAIFLRREVIRSVGGFDEDLGLGAGSPYQSGEETDYLLRVLGAGYKIVYEPSLVIGHKSFSSVASELVRIHRHAAGAGRVLRKHGYPLWFVLYAVSRSFGGFLLSLARRDFGRARFYLTVSAGRVSGWRAGR